VQPSREGRSNGLSEGSARASCQAERAWFCFNCGRTSGAAWRAVVVGLLDCVSAVGAWADELRVAVGVAAVVVLGAAVRVIPSDVRKTAGVGDQYQYAVLASRVCG
jgi:hypothetical protein